MTYEEAIQFWFGRVNYEHKSPQVGDFKLDRMRRLLELLGDPHRRLRIVHIAGSKGKGSTSALLGAILQAAGFRVGLFTSPHLVHVEERIQVDCQPIGHDALAGLMNEIRGAVPPELERELTFFEIGTALGFLHFLRRRVDFAVVEVGLGGRFDSTNVCDPMLSIITSISFDHTQMLGNTLAQIAFEKAGIIKPGRRAISGVRDPEARPVIERVCFERGAPLRQLDVDFRCVHQAALMSDKNVRLARVQVTTERRVWPAFDMALIGEHQARNATLAIAAVEELIEAGVTINDGAVANGLANVVWPARLEIIRREPLVVLDCAHNVASARALVQALDASFPLEPNRGRRILIFAGSRDKDLTGMLDVLAPKFERIYLTSFQTSQRCETPHQLALQLPRVRRSTAVLCASSAEAWRQAMDEARAEDLICIAGSVFLAGEMRPLIQCSHHAPRDGVG